VLLQRYTRGERYAKHFAFAKGLASKLAELPPLEAQSLEAQMEALLNAAVAQFVSRRQPRTAADLRNPPVVLKHGRGTIKACSGGASRAKPRRKKVKAPTASSSQPVSAAAHSAAAQPGKRTRGSPSKDKKKLRTATAAAAAGGGLFDMFGSG
jgi:hypothetical protein